MENNNTLLQNTKQTSQTRKLFHKINIQQEQPLPTSFNIFRQNKKQFDPNDKPVGGNNIIRKVRESILKSLPSESVNKVTMSTNIYTLPEQSVLERKTQVKTKTLIPQRISSSSYIPNNQEDVLKKDLVGLDIGHIKVLRKRPFTSILKPTIYERTAKPFLQNMGQRSMLQYNEELKKKFGNKYFQKTLRNSYQDDAPKSFMVTLFNGNQTKSNKIRKSVMKSSSSFFKTHKFIEIKGENKKERQAKATKSGFQ